MATSLEEKPEEIIVISAHLNRPDLPEDLGVDKYISKASLKDPKILHQAILEVAS